MFVYVIENKYVLDKDLFVFIKENVCYTICIHE